MTDEPQHKQTDLAYAIAHAEGFGRKGAIPTKAHNPGDLVIPGWKGATLGAEGISVFDSDKTGWAALEHQLDLIRSGRSKIYRPSMTIQEMAEKWTATEQIAWALNVVDGLAKQGRMATLETKLYEVL